MDMNDVKSHLLMIDRCIYIIFCVTDSVLGTQNVQSNVVTYVGSNRVYL